MRQPAYIPGLPEPLRVVPNDPEKWRLWAEAVKAYREKRRRECSRDVRQQEIEKERCRRSTTYFIAVWGVIFEARSVEGEPPSWKPFVLFPFQVHMIDWIEYTLTLDPDKSNGRGDGIVEKSRDMGATNIFCAVAVKHFLFDQVFVAGFQSRRFEDVDHKTKTGTIFYRIRSLLGIEDSVPPNLRLPRFLQPHGFDAQSHSLPGQGAIKNPEPGRTCVLVGETTTKLSSVSDRFTMRVSDEAARYPEFSQAWANQQAVTDHRYANSTADSDYGDAFYNMARLGEDCLIDPSRPGPAYLRLEWDLHPFHTPEWMAGQEARARSNANYEDFAREYKIEYFAQRGSLVYPLYKQVNPGDYPYDPYGGPIFCWIDPGISDPGAIVWAQQDYGRGGWNIFESFEGKGGEDAHFYASVLTGVYVSGEYQYDYADYDRLADIMEFTANLTLPVTYVGDPAGNARGGRGDDKSTWYQEVAIAAAKFSPTKRVFVNTITAENARSHLVRQDAVRFLMPQFRFDHGPGGARVLHCLKVSRYKKTQSGRSITEPQKPEHGPECLHGDTMIRTLDGWHPIRELVGRTDVWTYAYSHDEQRLVPTPVEKIFKSGWGAKVIEVGLDNGESIRCTPDHLFMLRSGEYRKAGDLSEGDSLMPFNDFLMKGYVQVHLNDGSIAAEHLYSYIRANGMPEQGCHVHHKDEVKTNNYPSNLVQLTHSEHTRITRPSQYVRRESYERRESRKDRIIKRCGWCEQEFLGTHRHIYCSKDCRREADLAQGRLRKGTKLNDLVCVICDSGFQSFNSRRKTCSEACQKQHHKNQVAANDQLRTARRRADSQKVLNHKVRFVRECDELADVYDMTVPKYHNFVAEGVMVHNSHIRTAVEYGAVWIRRMILAKNERVQQGSRKPIRVSMSGNVVSGRQREMFNRERRKIGVGPI